MLSIDFSCQTIPGPAPGYAQTEDHNHHQTQRHAGKVEKVTCREGVLVLHWLKKTSADLNTVRISGESLVIQEANEKNTLDRDIVSDDRHPEESVEQPQPPVGWGLLLYQASITVLDEYESELVEC